MPSYHLPLDTVLHGDNVALLSDGIPTGSVDLIYADPPFNSGHAYYATGRRHEGPRFRDAWRFDEERFQSALDRSHPKVRGALLALRTVLAPGTPGTPGNRGQVRGQVRGLGACAALAYCAELAPCLTQLQRVLKPTGSVYLHCDVRMSAYLRLMLDALFGRAQFRNEIAWAYRTGGAGRRAFARKHDAILFYTSSDDYTFHPQTERVRYRTRFFGAQQDADGYYADVLVRDVWDIPAVINVSAERTGYPTQKPLVLLERIVAASSNPGDVVLDPFCGSGTALLAAQRLGRSWIGMDASEEAVKLSKQRLAPGTPGTPGTPGNRGQVRGQVRGLAAALPRRRR
jgi:site-specific DNA-methyltransferase (adenine-specific)